MSLYKYVSKELLNAFGGSVGEAIADAEISKSVKDKMDDTNRRLIDKYGKGVWASAGTDNYYHPLLQCKLAQISPESMTIGGILGYLKEGYDFSKKVYGGQKLKEIIKDSRKDLKNNEYGAIIGSNNPNTPCEILLEDKRSKRMKNENIW